MSPHPSAETERPHFFWLSLGLSAITVFSLVLSGQQTYAAAGIGIALAVAFFRVVWCELKARSIAYLAVGTIAYLFAWNRGVPFLYAFSAACYAIVVVGHLLPRWVLRPVQGRINCPAAVLQGDTADLAIAVENPGNASLRMLELEIPIPGAVGEERCARALLARLDPGATKQLDIRTPPLRRGCHIVGPLAASTGFPLGLVTKSANVPASERTLWVYPRLFGVEFVPVAGEQFQQMGEAISPRTGGGEDFAGVREYRHGDSRRSIHWRASARQNRLIVKEFMRTVATTITIAVDLGRAANVGNGIHTAAEDAIRIAGSVARYALEQQHHVQLLLCGATVKSVGPLKDLAELDIVLQALALARCDGDKTFGDHLESIAASIARNSTAVLVYVDANAGSLGTIATMQQQGVLVVPVVVEAASYEAASQNVSAPTPAVRARSRRARLGCDFPALFRE